MTDVSHETKAVIRESNQEDNNVLTIHICKCGRAPHRKNARNCHFCHKEANKKYRATIRQQLKQLRAILWAARNGA